MSPASIFVCEWLQRQRHFCAWPLYILFKCDVKHRLHCLVLTVTNLYIFTRGKTNLVNQRWRHTTCLQHLCYDVGCYPCITSLSYGWVMCPENVVCFIPLAEYIPVLFKLDFIMETNTINPDQNDPRSAHYDRMNVCLNSHYAPPPPIGNLVDISYLVENWKRNLLRNVCTLCIVLFVGQYANNRNQDQTPQNVASDQGLNYLLT